MQIYLPIAELSLNVFQLLAIGGGVGFLSGLFGVGGGFLMTPLLILIGVPAPVAVATQANQVMASSVSGALSHWSRGNLDLKMGGILLLGGAAGSTVGVFLFSLLRSLGQLDLAIRLAYVLFLGVIGALMLAESASVLIRRRRKLPQRGKLHQHGWMHGLPMKMRFRKSRLYISAILPFAIGALAGLLAAIMGVGGAFFMVPAMIYILGMPTSIVVGTSLFQIIFVTANVTFLHAIQNHTVDIVLALILTIGGVTGAQFGSRIGARLPGTQWRILLALLVLGVSGRLGYELVAPPASYYSIDIAEVSP